MYYIFCAKYQHPAAIVFTIVLHILTTVDLVTLAFKDPGMIPKVLVNYESSQLEEIPLDPRYTSDY